MYRNIVVGVDGQQGGRDAAALAAQLASPEASMTPTYVSVAVPTGHVTNLDLEPSDDASLHRRLEEELRLCGEHAQLRRVASNSVGAGLEDTAERLDADLIVVGCSRRHGINRLLSGDDVKSVVHQTPTAVAVAPRSYAHHRVDLRRIGVAYDRSPESGVAVAHAGLLASERSATLTPCHVVEPHYYPVGWGMVATPVDDPGIQLAAARERFAQVNGIEVEHVYGAVRDELVAFSQTVDLLVCGSRRNGPVRRLAFGSTSEYLTRHVDVPLLIAPSTDTPTIERWLAERQAAMV